MTLACTSTGPLRSRTWAAASRIRPPFPSSRRCRC
jgi:hypothetical protein